MKKGIILLLAAMGLCMSFAVAGCSGQPSGEVPGGTQQEQQPGTPGGNPETPGGNPETPGGNPENPGGNPQMPGGEEPGTPGEVQQVTDHMLDAERKYTGTLVDGLPEGEGVLEWVNTNCVYTGDFSGGVYEGEGVFVWRSSGDTLEGTFAAGVPVYGTYTYANTMHYTGQFNSAWQFHGEGTFDWNTYREDGTLLATGWLYEGGFQNGSPAGCRGRVTFIRDNENAGGVHWFEGEMSGFPEVKRNQHGKGKIRFGDNSTYEGDIFYTANGEWKRKGEGVMDFRDTTFLGSAAGGPHADKLMYYKGAFDADVTGWMFGNGVMYFADANGTPTGYIRGTWRGMTRTGPWQGAWEEELLLAQWRNTQELAWKSEFVQKLTGFVAEIEDVDLTGKTLLIGASHFEFWTTSQQDLAPEVASENIAVGGTNVAFWNENFALLDGLQGSPAYIVYNEMGNSLVGGMSPEQFLLHMQSLAQKVASKFPGSKFVVTSGLLAPARWAQREKFKQANAALAQWAATQNDVIYADLFHISFGAETGTYVDETYGTMRMDIWRADNVHFNAEGYRVLTAAYIDFFKQLREGTR